MNIYTFLNSCRNLVESQANKVLQKQINHQVRVALDYALIGGKCIRAAILLAISQHLGIADRNVIQPVLALEMIHAYSLVHDDLPAMDNDPMRRGKASCHVQFGEANAILIGDSLLTLAFEQIACSVNQTISNQQAIDMLKILSQKAGVSGMIYGQWLDMQYTNAQPIDLETLKTIHSHKTSDLIIAALQMGAVCGNRYDLLKPLENIGYKLGLCFQIRDDILDMTKSSEKLGKTAQSDIQKNKATYPKLMGPELAQRQAEILYEEIIQAIQTIKLEKSYILSLTDFILKRNY